MVIVYGYTKCTTVKKALKFLNDNNVEYKHIDNVEDKLTFEELNSIYKNSKLPLKRMFNTSGMKYRELGLKDKFDKMTEEEALKLLATDGMLVKRPILKANDKILIGFKTQEWEELVNSK